MASQPKPTLANIPTELVIKIATFYSLRDLANLGKTCRHFHIVCKDPLVVERVFLEHLDEPTSTSIPNKEALYKIIRRRLAEDDTPKDMAKRN
ncbi:hypothetical protein B0H63DRAFT_518623 [Podospora didyma]|uniref:F-box domain-containing protein n=1 Tax=Podospora didyma TaxID=330526 RepID=A0AAE0U3D6_9PEZI|nr:hypothetical protein B0H63DRAFT_518623 [Podospora didyma]